MFEDFPYGKGDLSLWNVSDDLFKEISYTVKKVKVIIYKIALWKQMSQML